MAEEKPVAAQVEKIMSIKPVEFEAGIVRLDSDAPASATTARDITTYAVDHPAAGGGPVRIVFEKLEPAVLGGLMRLPRAKVTLYLEGLSDDARRAFLGIFDQTFQRGGG